MAEIRFYEVDKTCMFSRAVELFGGIKHDMRLTHCALEWDGFVNDLTIDGIGYYSIEEEEEVRTPIIHIEVEIDHSILYERSLVFAYTGLKLGIIPLLKKAFNLPMLNQDLLCTDYVQILLGEAPQHLTPVEYLNQLIEKNVGLN